LLVTKRPTEFNQLVVLGAVDCNAATSTEHTAVVSVIFGTVCS